MKTTLSQEALNLHHTSDVIDLHLDTFIWKRIFGYDMNRRHGISPIGSRLFGQVDLPRLKQGGVSGAIWSITTQPFATAAKRRKALLKNLESLKQMTKEADKETQIVRTHSDYLSTKIQGNHAMWIGVQGGSAFGGDLQLLETVALDLIKVTLVHLSTSEVGVTSAPFLPLFKRPADLTQVGMDMIKILNSKRSFVDLAHISEKGFSAALEVHDSSQPVLVSHTCADAIHPHWRNIKNDQIKKIADTGGIIGIMYQSSFLNGTYDSSKLDDIIDHLNHFVKVGGEDCVALGSDWDGMIMPPRELRSCENLPLLTQRLLERGWSEIRVKKLLGQNFLRALKSLRP